MSEKYAPPAFQFYARSYLEGCAHMTLAEQGAYMRLLCHQWERGTLPDAPDQLARLLGLTRRAFDRIWVGIADKFPGTPPTNAALERVRMEQKTYHDKKAQAGQLGAERRWRKDGTAMPVPLANGCPPVSSLQSERLVSESIAPHGGEPHRKAVRSRERNDKTELPGIERQRADTQGMTKITDLLPRTA